MLRHPSIILIACALLLLSQLSVPGNAVAADASARYSIVLASAPGKNLKWEPPERQLFDGYTLYVEQATIKGSPWERLCLGFFSPRKDASSILKEVQQVYPGAWVQKVSTKNILSTIYSPTDPAATASTLSATTSKLEKAVTGGTSSLTEKQLDSLMQRAKTDFKNKNYTSAIRYLKALIAAGEHRYSREALELLGLARQRKGQKTHAVDSYEKYLTLYPEGEGSDRVRQRLAGLLTAARAPRKKIHMSSDEENDEVITNGSLSQFYRANRASTDGIGGITTLSQLFTFLDLTTVQRSGKYDHRYQFTSDHTYDFLSSSDGSEFRFIETYYELSSRKTGSSGRLGRQAIRTGGILKRFDGLTFGYQFTPEIRLNVLGGLPVDVDNKTSINKSRSFYGFIFETGTFLEHWDMNLFYFDQEVDGLTDRRSTGADVRYRDKTKALFAVIDYELFYKEINLLQLNANILFDHGRSAYMNAFIRKLPMLATSNALTGRPEESLEEMQKNLNVEQIYQLARDRTANSQSTTVGGTQGLSEKFQLSGDITVSHIDGTVATAADALVPAGIPATEETGPDYFISTQLVGNSLFLERDTAVLGIRYYQTEPSDTISFIINSRFPLTRNWRINPRLQYDIRKLSNGDKQEKLRARLKTDYRYLSKLRFDFEVGYDESTENDNQLDLGSNNLFFTLGYRWDF